MRSAPPALLSLLNSGNDFEQADIWRITLSGGQVIRWTSADMDLTVNGETYVCGPLLSRGSVSDRVGLETTMMDLEIDADESDLINGVSVIRFISQRGMDGAVVQLRRVFLPAWNAPAAGSILRFAGRVTSVGGISGNTAAVTIASWTILLNVNFPPDLYQVPCLNSVYDQKCGLDRDDWIVSSSVVAGPLSERQFATGLSLDDGWLAQGTIRFTSGPNSGISRSVRTSTGDGTVTLVQPLPAVPDVGDTFTALPGCGLTRGICSTKFNNILRHRGFPFVPTPETSL